MALLLLSLSFLHDTKPYQFILFKTRQFIKIFSKNSQQIESSL